MWQMNGILNYFIYFKKKKKKKLPLKALRGVDNKIFTFTIYYETV